MVSVLDSGVNSSGLSLGQGHCVVFLGKTLNSHNASLTHVYKWAQANSVTCNTGGNPKME